MRGEEHDESWLEGLKLAYDAGYYRTEEAEDEQSRFPWQNRTCGDCPFWIRSTCLVREELRSSDAHTCRYFDRSHREDGRVQIGRRRWELLRQLG